MPFDPNAFMKALTSQDHSSPGTPTVFSAGYRPAQFISNQKLSTTQSILGRLNAAGGQVTDPYKATKRGWFGNTIDWLMSGGQAVENSAMDVTQAVKGEKSWGDALSGVGQDLGAGVLGYLKPVTEVGGLAPWSNAESGFLEKNKSEFHGTGPIQGTRLLDEWGWKPTGSLGNSIGRGLAGFGLDVATDPLTYVGPGAIAHVIGRGSLEAAKSVPFRELGMLGTPNELATASKIYELQKPIAEAHALLSVDKPSDIASKLKSNFGDQLAERDRLMSTLNPIQQGIMKDHYDTIARSVSPVARNSNIGVVSKQAQSAMQKDLHATLFGGKNAAGNDVVHSLVDLKTGRLTADAQSIALAKTIGPEGITQSMETLSKVIGRKLGIEPPTMLETIKSANMGTARAMINAAQNGRILYKGAVNPWAVEYLSRAVPDALRAGHDISEFSPVAKILPPAAETGALAEKAATDLAKNVVGKDFGPKLQSTLFTKLQGLGLQGGELLGGLQHAEEALMRNGFKLTDWNKNTLRLSHVFENMGLDKVATLTPEEMASGLKAYGYNSWHGVTGTPADFRDGVTYATGRNLGVRTAVENNFVDQFFARYHELEDLVPPERLRAWVNNKVTEVQKQTQDLGFTAREGDAVSSQLKNWLGSDGLAGKTTPEIMAAVREPLAKQFDLLDKGYKASTLQRGIVRWKIIRAINKDLGIKDTKALGVADVFNKTQDFFGRNFTTWYGRGAMKALELQDRTLAQAQAHGRAAALNNLYKMSTPEQRSAAWALVSKAGQTTSAERVAIGEASGQTAHAILGAANALNDVDPVITQLAHTIEAYMTEVFGPGSDLISHLRLGPRESIAMRAGLIPQDINRYLKAMGSHWELGTKGDAAGKWYDSWRNIDLGKVDENPITFLYNIDLAVQKTLTEYDTIDSFAAMFGHVPGELGHDPAIHTARLSYDSTSEAPKGFYAIPRISPQLRFEPDVAKQFQKLHSDLRRGQWRPQPGLSRYMATAMRNWKSAVTIYFPAHHIRNIIGDSWLMWSAGYNDPRVFQKAMKVISANRRLYKGAIQEGDLPTYLKLSKGSAALDPTAYNTDSVVSHLRGAKLNAGEVYHAMNSRGLLLETSQIEDLAGNMMKFERHHRITAPFKGSLHDAATAVSEVREHYVRAAHMIGYLEKYVPESLSKKLATAGPMERDALLSPYYDKAAQEIRKYHPDGTDMSYMEQKYLRFVVPFYSWQRKAIPLALEAMVLRPAKITAYPKAIVGLQRAMGIEGTSAAEPFPQDQLFPDWMQSGAIGPVANSAGGNWFGQWWGKLGTNIVDSNGKEQGYTMFDPFKGASPISSLTDLFGNSGGYTDTMRGIGQNLNPLFGITSGLLTGKTLSGGNVSTAKGGKGALDYIARQVPQVQLGASLKDSNTKGKQNVEGGFNLQRLLTFLGVPVEGTGQYIKTAELQQKDKLKNG